MDYLEIGCACCEFQYNLWLIAGEPPAPPNRNSDPKGDLHKELMQCQFCFKSRREGVTFFRCGGCQIEIYCVSAVCPGARLVRMLILVGRAEQRVPEEGMEQAQAEVRHQPQVPARRRRRAEADEGPPRVHVQAPAVDI